IDPEPGRPAASNREAPMSPTSQVTPPQEDPAIRHYTYLCIAALLALLFVLVQRRLGFWSFFPVLVGALGLAMRWRTAPVILLLTVASFLLFETILHPRARFE